MLHPYTSFRRAAGWLLLALLALAGRPAWATHIVGGEMDLQYLGSGNNYQLSMTLYFDNNGNPNALDQSLTAGIYDKATNQLMTTVVMPLISRVGVAYTNAACAVGQLSTDRLTYRNTLTLAPDRYTGTQGYYAVIERCCRNNGITNIVNPQDAAQAFYLEFPAVVRNGQPFRDSTPRLFSPLSDYACVGDLFTYDFGGQDPDGDSLVYDLVTPLNGHANTLVPSPGPAPGPYSTVTWQPGLSATNQIPGNPGLTIGPRTGRLQVRPTQAGLFVFGIRCQQYRNKVRLGETRRDFQLLARVCTYNAPPKVLLYSGTAGNTAYVPGRDVLNLVPGGPRCVRLRFTDPDNASQLSLRLRDVDYGGLLPTFTTAVAGTVHAAGMPDTLVATLCFPDCADTKGQVRHLDVIVADNGCALPKQDTVHLAFTATLAANSPPTLAHTAGAALPLHLRLGQTLAFDLIATDPEGDPITMLPTGATVAALANQGATITYDNQAGTQRVAHFRWPIDCRAVTTPPGQTTTLTFGASSTSACNNTQAAPTVSVPIVVDYSNLPPTLTTSFPPDSAGRPPLIRVPLGQLYTATLSGTDPDRDVLTLGGTGQGFSLPAAGMHLTPATGSPAGQAAATFSWQPGCDGGSVVGGQAQERVVTFQLQEATCQPQPQTRVVRFLVVNPDAADGLPPNIILPNGTVAANTSLTMAKLPADFCDSRFADIKIFSRWGRLVYQSSSRDFAWRGEGSAGLYYYLLSYTSGHRYKGWVEVVQ